MGACTVAEGYVDVYPEPKDPVTIDFTAEEINRRLGTQIEGSEMADTLTRLGFSVETRLNGTCRATVPSWRSDCTYMEDLSEEVARIHGFDKIASTTPFGRMVQGKQGAKQNLVTRIKHTLAALGMTEELSFAFTSKALFDKLLVPQDSPFRKAIPILNPLTDAAPLVRTCLLTSIMENAVRNFSQYLSLRYRTCLLAGSTSCDGTAR